MSAVRSTPARVLPFRTKQWLAMERAARRRDELIAEMRLLQNFLDQDAVEVATGTQEAARPKGT